MECLRILPLVKHRPLVKRVRTSVNEVFSVVIGQEIYFLHPVPSDFLAGPIVIFVGICHNWMVFHHFEISLTFLINPILFIESHGQFMLVKFRA